MDPFRRRADPQFRSLSQKLRQKTRVQLQKRRQFHNTAKDRLSNQDSAVCVLACYDEKRVETSPQRHQLRDGCREVQRTSSNFDSANLDEEALKARESSGRNAI
jgi:hypothetical protein